MLLSLLLLNLFVHEDSYKDYLIFKKQAILLLGELKLASKTINFVHKTMKIWKLWLQKQFVKIIYTNKPQMSSPVPNWNSLHHHIHQHTCTYFTVFPAISVTVELTLTYTNMGVSSTEGNWIKEISFISFDQKSLFKNQIREFFFGVVKFVSYEKGFSINSLLLRRHGGLMISEVDARSRGLHL